MRCSPRLMSLALLGLCSLVPALAAAQSPAPTEATPPADAEKAAKPAPEATQTEDGAKAKELKELERSGKLPARDRIVERRRRGQ